MPAMSSFDAEQFVQDTLKDIPDWLIWRIEDRNPEFETSDVSFWVRLAYREFGFESVRGRKIMVTTRALLNDDRQLIVEQLQVAIQFLDSRRKGWNPC